MDGNMIVTNSGPVDSNIDRQTEIFLYQFYEVAGVQGTLAYFFMSIHAVNPYVLQKICSGNIYSYLYANMIYGFAFILFSRVSLMSMGITQRISCSILGSLMFNRTSLLVFDYVAETWGYKSSEPSLGLATFLGIIYGRILVGELFGFLSHIDNQVLRLLSRNRP